jgi:hypothetical protein
MRECKRKKNAILSKVSDIHLILGGGGRGGAAFVCFGKTLQYIAALTTILN